ncbi:MAG: hypothetical protein Q4A83_04275 [Bacillota bacterium]|nr:hypothetical protein [Bacillota bacterium]
MKKFVVPMVLAAGAAVAVMAMGKKKPAAKGAAPAAKGAKKPEMKNPKTEVYSFVSGYQNPATIEVSMKFDADKVDLNVIEEGFMVASSNPQVVTALSGQFNLQLEPTNFYTGETFDSMSAEAKEKFTGFGEVCYGAMKGIKYNAGDGVIFCFPADEASYLMVNTFKGPDNDDEVADLPENAELGFFFENVSIEKKA